jgi:hypothetical protein
VRTYAGLSQAASAAEFEADAARAAASGYFVTSQAWEGNSLTVTYQLAVGTPPAGPPSSPDPGAPAPNAKKKQNPAQQAAGCAVLIVIALVVIGYLGSKDKLTTDSEPGGGGAPQATSRGPSTPRPTPEPTPEATSRGPSTPRPTPEPTPTPVGELSLSDVRVTSRVRVGDDVQVRFHATNEGPGTAPVIIRIGGPSGKAEFRSCSRRCVDNDEILGTRYLDFPDLKAGRYDDFLITYRTLEPGRIDWSVRPDDQPDELWTATTVVTQ